MSKVEHFQNPLEDSSGSIEDCRRKLIPQYVRGELTGNLFLEFLLHVDECQKCRNAVLAARKAEHPEFYGATTANSLKLVNEK
jgi:hypothetical protein